MLRHGSALALLVLSVFALAPPAAAASGGVYVTADAAQSTCSGEEVVWLDFDRMKYVHKDQPGYGQRKGAYACISTARAKSYIELKSSTQGSTQ